MVLMGLTLGLAGFLVDPFTGQAAAWKLTANVLAVLLLLPAWRLPNHGDSYFSLNEPAWSLMWEYLANIAYALVLWRLNTRALIVVVLLAALALGASAYTAGTLMLGWGWGQMLHALARTSFSFGAGLLLFRARLVPAPLGFVSLSLLLIGLFLMPIGRFNGLYELMVALADFPLIVALGARAKVSGLSSKLCRSLGRISYPLYAVHYTVASIFGSYFVARGIPTDTLPWVITGLTLLALLISYAALVLYDETVRRWLNRTFRNVTHGTQARPPRRLQGVLQ